MGRDWVGRGGAASRGLEDGRVWGIAGDWGCGCWACGWVDAQEPIGSNSIRVLYCATGGRGPDDLFANRYECKMAMGFCGGGGGRG